MITPFIYHVYRCFYLLLIIPFLIFSLGCAKENGEAVSAPFASEQIQAGNTAGMIKVNSIDEFDKILNENSIVLTDFYADWCGPCHMLKPILKEINNNYRGRVKIVEVDIDKFQSIAERYKVQGIPDVRIFKNGQIKNSFVGVQPKENYSRALDRLMDN